MVNLVSWFIDPFSFLCEEVAVPFDVTSEVSIYTIVDLWLTVVFAAVSVIGTDDPIVSIVK